MSCPNFGFFRVPEILMGNTIPAPGFLKNGSNAFRKNPLTPPPSHLRQRRLHLQLAFEVDYLVAQAVAPGKLDRSARNRERQARELHHGVVQYEAPPQVRQHIAHLFVVVQALPAAAQPGQLCLDAGIGELRLRQDELSAQLQLVDHFFLFRWNDELRLQARCTQKDRLLGLDGESQQVFDPAILHVHVDLDLPATHAFEPDHRSVCGHRRLEKRGIHLLEVRVAVRPIDDGGEASVQRHGLAAHVHLKIRGVCRSLNLDAVKRAVELSGRAQHAGEPMDGVEIRVREHILSGDGRARRMRDVPRSEGAGCFDLALRHRIGQRCDVRNGLIDAERVHHEMMDGEDLRLLPCALRNECDDGVGRLEPFDDDPLQIADICLVLVPLTSLSCRRRHPHHRLGRSSPEGPAAAPPRPSEGAASDRGAIHGSRTRRW